MSIPFAIDRRQEGVRKGILRNLRKRGVPACIAKRSGTCAFCGEPVAAGQILAKSGDGWLHHTCEGDKLMGYDPAPVRRAREDEERRAEINAAIARMEAPAPSPAS